MNTTDRSIGPMGVSVLALAAALQGCFLSDHSERNDEVGTDVIHHPTSGYQQVDAEDLPRITFDDTRFDMGSMVQGAKVEHRFTFHNTGGSPLVIAGVRSTCGCTVGKDWPREPIPPGKGGTITVTFDSEGRSGRQEKVVTVIANTSPPSTILTLTGEVIGPQGLEPVK